MTIDMTCAPSVRIEASFSLITSLYLFSAEIYRADFVFPVVYPGWDWAWKKVEKDIAERDGAGRRNPG